MNITGKITVLRDMETVGKDAMSKREFVIEELGQEYPNSLCITTLKDKVSMLDMRKVGDEVSVEYNTKAREYNGKYFTNINAWKIETIKVDGLPDSEEDNSDLPFN